MKVAEDRRTVKVRQNALLVRFFMHPVGKTLLGLIAVAMIASAALFVHFYNKYSKLIDERLSGGAYTTTSRIYAAPGNVTVGDDITASDIATALRHAGYNEHRGNAVGYYTTDGPESINIFPGPDSYFDQEAFTIKFSKGKVSRIISLGDNSDRPMYELEPQLITNLHDRKREKQRVVRYEDIPEDLKNAVLSAEDKRFLSHSGFDPIGIARAAWVDIRRGRNEQGASTLTMQVAKNMFLTLDRTWRRKAAEIMITMQLESDRSRLSRRVRNPRLR
jgi:penicillin-binding protein 1B